MRMRGMTLVELLVTMFIGGVMAYTVGMIIVSTFTESTRSFQQASLQDDVRYFERKLGKQFRSALNEAAVISGGGTPASGNTLQFVSYAEGGYLTGLVRYVYRVEGGALVCYMTPMIRDGGGILIPTPNVAGTKVDVLGNIDAVTFSWVNWPTSHTVSTVLTQKKTLPGRKSYVHTSAFTVLSRNRS